MAGKLEGKVTFMPVTRVLLLPDCVHNAGR